MFDPTILCIYDDRPTNQPRQKNNTNRLSYHRQRSTNHYPTQNEGNTNNDNQLDSESKNQQQQQQEITTTTTNEIQQPNQAENREQKETTNS